MRFEGFHEDHELPVKRGDTVTIRKGTSIKTTHPTKKEIVAGRTYTVKINHILNGTSEANWEFNTWTQKYEEVRKPLSNPSVRWAGAGGYWYEVDVNDIPEFIKG